MTRPTGISSMTRGVLADLARACEDARGQRADVLAIGEAPARQGTGPGGPTTPVKLS